MLIYPIKKILHFCLIRRASKNTVHSNQIAFPGGEKNTNPIKLLVYSVT